MDTMKDIISENHIIKFFDEEEYAKKFLFNGEMLFNPLERFAGYAKIGRGDPDEKVFKCHGAIYCKEQSDEPYRKLVDFNSLERDKKRLIYCYATLRKGNFSPNGAFRFNIEALQQFALENSPVFGVILDREQFENKVTTFLRKAGVGFTIADIKYTNEEVSPQLVIQAQLNQSDLAYFHKSLNFYGQQERRIILREHLETLVERGIAEKFKEGGGKIYIGDITALGRLCKVEKSPNNENGFNYALLVQDKHTPRSQ